MQIDDRGERPIALSTAVTRGVSPERGHSAEYQACAGAEPQAATATESSEKCRCCPDQRGRERGDGGHTIGKNPSTMEPVDLEALGHKPMSAQRALRLRCLDCCSGSAHEVRRCQVEKCPSWPFRMGRSPWRQKLTEKQREAKRKALARNLATAPEPDNYRASAAKSG
jgi:hypothetical protein